MLDLTLVSNFPKWLTQGYNEIGLCAQNIDVIQGSIVSIIRWTYAIVWIVRKKLTICS